MKHVNIFHGKRKNILALIRVCKVWGGVGGAFNTRVHRGQQRLNVYPLTLKTVWPQRQAVSGCGPVMMCSQSPQCPDGSEHTSF